MEPVLVDLPETLETERLILRSPRAGDGAAVNAAILETWDSLHHWMLWAAERPSVDETEGFMRRQHASFIARTGLNMLMFRRDSQTFVGAAGLSRMNWTLRRFEIGYWIRQSCVGQGLMSEAVTALTQLAFTTLAAVRVEIHTSHRNVRSQRVAERCGFVLEGRLRAFGREPSGELRDEMIYGRVASVGA
ncbi:MAG: GNAT family N-acetyltransferase [Kofleriaceae bacterium]